MADPELDAQVQRFERKLKPRSRAVIEADISTIRALQCPKVERYNYLLERISLAELELAQLRPSVEEYERDSFDLDWEYFRRLQLDGVLPSLPRVVSPANNNDNEERDDDDGRHEHDFEVGSKG